MHFLIFDIVRFQLRRQEPTTPILAGIDESAYVATLFRAYAYLLASLSPANYELCRIFEANGMLTKVLRKSSLYQIALYYQS